ncbi:Arc1p [Sugiyamaella lignohabitans]|uniref:Arc1p n=1 Tax=Sugiyamaella lignohabitans TaxID=796027 RepID=A0A167D9W4_9ASCO|nr:Arc1p [Sugiyamaella lignohabitans]ANB12659.1 Arc1p [Sugiyamaella lignohabitans]
MSSVESLTKAFEQSLSLKDKPETLVAPLATLESGVDCDEKKENSCEAGATRVWGGAPAAGGTSTPTSRTNRDQANAALVKLAPADLTEIQSAELNQWLTVSGRFPEGIEQLNETLKTRTYILETHEATVADAVVLSRIAGTVKSWSNDEVKLNRHIVRWLDLVQNVIGIKDEDKVTVNKDLEAPREIKVKPKKDDKAGDKAGDKASKKDKKAKKGAEGAVPAAEGAAAAASAAGATTAGAVASAEGEAKGDAAGAGDDKKKQGVKKEKKKKPQPVKEELVISPGLIDLRVGYIEKAIKHPDADSLYVSTIQMGDADGPRTVCSGLVKYFPLEAMQGRYVVVVANLKPVNMRGIKSSAMVLCASNDDTVEFVNPPEGSKPGDKIFFETYDLTPEPVLNPKKKIWETVQPGFSTNAALEVTYRKDESEPERKLVNKAGLLCKVNSLVSAVVR